YRVGFFFFQAEDGIRDFHVTEVQTCALPISTKISPTTKYSWMGLSRIWMASVVVRRISGYRMMKPSDVSLSTTTSWLISAGSMRSEERRVGKEARTRRSL